VYTFDRSIPDTPAFLCGVAEEQTAMQTPDPSAEEKEFMFHLRDDFYGSFTPACRLGAGDVPVFLVAVEVTPDRLPAGKLDRPYLNAAAIEGYDQPGRHAPTRRRGFRWGRIECRACWQKAERGRSTGPSAYGPRIPAQATLVLPSSMAK
jgi:hypothetical protein